MKIAIGTDHRGFSHKAYIKKNMLEHTWIDVGAYEKERTDYPLYAQKGIDLFLQGEVDCAVLLCGTGIGMAMFANRYNRVYAAVVWNTEIAFRARSEDNINVLVLPSDFVSQEQSVSIVDVWLSTDFKGGRYAERLEMIDK